MEIGDFMEIKGLDEEKVIEISRLKNEPEWMCNFRLKAYQKFIESPQPTFGPELKIDFDTITYYKTRASSKVEKSWDDVPENVRETFDKLGLPEAEKKYLAGIGAQYESEVVYHNMIEELEEKNILFCDTDTLFADHRAAAALAHAVDHLFVGQHAFAGSTPVDGHGGFIGQTLFK